MATSAHRAPDWVAAGTPEPLRSLLTDALGADRVLPRALDLVRYASDASPYRLIPRAVVMPRGVGDVVKLLAVARERRIPLVFRAGGTSLSGQAQSESVLVDVRRHWQQAKIEEEGRLARVAPGIVLGRVNRLLARHGRRLGPDPASTDIACVGGVIANNSGGMRCGVHADSYRTVRALKFVLANGAVIDTAAPDAEQRFAHEAPELAAGVEAIRDELRADAELCARVRRKFEIKNTTGYRLCALLDADEPLEIFRRLIVGSEGTLAFIAEAVFETVPFGRHSTVALVFFENLDAAASAVGPIVAAGASATELMVASTLVAAAHNMAGTPDRWKELPPDAAALLIEFRSDEPPALERAAAAACEILEGSELVEPARFSTDPAEIAMMWRVREGMLGLLAELRQPGAQLIIEDVCFPPERIAEGARDLQELLVRHGFLPGIAGHASAGNLHFLLSPNFAEQGDRERYESLMEDLVELIVGKYDGSLKAEHGTGLNMAPFVRREWGAKATEMMWRIKQLADPDGILAPGVVLNDDPHVHLRALKDTPEIEEVATKCIECGFCEPVCPSRDLTTTPRQRIVLRREIARQPPDGPVRQALLDEYTYDGIDTCAADGSCMVACPLGIDTGKLIKELRRREHGSWAPRAARAAARHYGLAEATARAGLRVGGGGLRRWRESIPRAAPRRLPDTSRAHAAAVYMPACINRIFGNDADGGAHPTLPEAMVAVSARAGMPLWIPPDVAGTCCGMPWSSKGYDEGQRSMAATLSEAMRRWSDGGRLPVVIDATSCTNGVQAEVRPEGVEVLDSIAWVHDHLLERLPIRKRLGTVAIHPTCASIHLGLQAKLEAIADRIAEQVVIPAATGCCGMAGDRGWLHPELPQSALREVARELDGHRLDACLSSNRTCEAALRGVTGRPYMSFVLALEQLTRAAPVTS